MKYKASLQFGNIAHVFNRAVGTGQLFREQTNFVYFLDLIIKNELPFCFKYTYYLLRNHCLMLIRVKKNEALIEGHKKRKKTVPPINIDWFKYVIAQFGNRFDLFAKALSNKYDCCESLFCDYMRHTEILKDDYFHYFIHDVHRYSMVDGLCAKIENCDLKAYHRFVAEDKTHQKREFVLKNTSKLRGFYPIPHRRVVDFGRIDGAIVRNTFQNKPLIGYFK